MKEKRRFLTQKRLYAKNNITISHRNFLIVSASDIVILIIQNFISRT